MYTLIYVYILCICVCQVQVRAFNRLYYRSAKIVQRLAASLPVLDSVYVCVYIDI